MTLTILVALAALGAAVGFAVALAPSSRLTEICRPRGQLQLASIYHRPRSRAR